MPTVLWVWIHVLQFTLANQIKAPEEDRVNKPSRPLPPGRISLRSATIFWWLIAPLCLAYSSLYTIQLVFASVQMQLFTVWYNELDGDKNWLSKNVVLAIMYGCLELGGTLSAGLFIVHHPPCSICHPARDLFHARNIEGRDPSEVSETAKLMVQLTIAVFTSTVHCQDFKDIEGDVSLAAVPSQSCSPSPPASSSAWISPYGHTSSAASGTSIGTVRSRSWRMDVSSEDGSCACARATRDADRRSCKYYSASPRSVAVMAVIQSWFSIHHLLPGYWNYFHDNNEARGGELIQKT